MIYGGPILASLSLTAILVAGPIAAQDAPGVWYVQNDTHGAPLTAPNGSAPPNAKKSGRELNTVDDLIAAIRRCYQPPGIDEARPGMRMNVQFSYDRNGELFGKPRILYETPGATPEQQSAYRMAVAAALARCGKLPFSTSLGSAVAGHIFAIQFYDARNLRGA